MRIKIGLSIGLVGATREEVIEIEEEEFEGIGMSREEYIDEVAQEWANNYIDVSWREVMS